MKRVLLVLAVLALLVPIAARADGIDLLNQGGTVTITDQGIVSKGSELVQFNQIRAPKGRTLGYVSFSTGALASGSIWTGGTFSDVGSSFIVLGKGKYGEPRGTIFSGTFIGPIDWTIVATRGRNFVEFQLSGEIGGELWTGRYVTGTTVQTIDTYKNQEVIDHKGVIRLSGTHLNTPEPGTLGLLGTGLLAIAGAFRRR